MRLRIWANVVPTVSAWCMCCTADTVPYTALLFGAFLHSNTTPCLCVSSIIPAIWWNNGKYFTDLNINSKYLVLVAVLHTQTLISELPLCTIIRDAGHHNSGPADICWWHKKWIFALRALVIIIQVIFDTEASCVFFNQSSVPTEHIWKQHILCTKLYSPLQEVSAFKNMFWAHLKKAPTPTISYCWLFKSMLHSFR